MNLKDNLRQIYTEGRANRPAEETEVMDRAAEALFESGQADRAINVGSIAPTFELENAVGELVSLADLLTRGPVVVSFYRGSWCPYCNMELRTLQANISEFEKRGARLVAISPQVADESMSVTEKHELTFDVLSDVGSGVSGSYGLAFDIPAELAQLYEDHGHDLIRANGGHDHTLVIPASYVIGQDGIVKWAFVNSDYTQRAEPADMLNALDSLH